MKRAMLILVAALAVLLVYPATMPSAKSPSTNDSPTIHIITPHVPGGDDPNGTDDNDDGDADDVSGFKDGRPSGATVVISAKSMAKAWWMYLYYLIR